jgi:hypothetical protein
LVVANEVRCFHSHPPADEAQLSEGVDLRGVVICVHPFGLGVYMPDEHAFGHVDAPMMGLDSTNGLDDYPSVGSMLSLTVLGYSGTGQLRLRVTG